MILLPHLEQGSPEWLAWRKTGLGCSDAPAIMGASPWKTPRQLWEEKLGRAMPEDSTFAMRRGQRMEGPARQLYEERTGRAVRPCCGRHERWAYLLASLDGIDVWGRHAIEIKAPNVECHAQALEGSVPNRYWPQTHAVLLVSGAERLDYVSYSLHRSFEAEQQLAVVEVLPDPAYLEVLLWQMSAFWLALQLGTWPEVLDRPPPIPTPAAAVS